MEYNDRNNVITETDEEGNVIEYTYGDEANPDLETKVKETSAEGKVVYEVEYSYDSNGNVIKETDHIEKTIINYSYDKDGNEFVIESDLIPGYPILVIKGNERVGKVDQLTKAIENNIVDLNGENNVMLYFYDDVFNNQNEYAENQINVVTKSYDPEHTTVPEYMKKWV